MLFLNSQRADERVPMKGSKDIPELKSVGLLGSLVMTDHHVPGKK